MSLFFNLMRKKYLNCGKKVAFLKKICFLDFFGTHLTNIYWMFSAYQALCKGRWLYHSERSFHLNLW